MRACCRIAGKLGLQPARRRSASGSTPLPFPSASFPTLILRLRLLPSMVVTRFVGTTSSFDPVRTGPAPNGPPVVRLSAATGTGLPCCISSPRKHVIATAPGDPWSFCHSALFSLGDEGSGLHSGSFPPWTTGSASASFVSELARRSLRPRPACSPSCLQQPFSSKTSSHFYLLLCFDCYRVGQLIPRGTLAG